MPNRRPDMIGIGHRLWMIRRSCGLNQAQAAALVGVSPVQWHNYELGYDRVSFPCIIRLANRLGLSVTEFVPTPQDESDALAHEPRPGRPCTSVEAARWAPPDPDDSDTSSPYRASGLDRLRMKGW